MAPTLRRRALPRQRAQRGAAERHQHPWPHQADLTQQEGSVEGDVAGVGRAVRPRS
jgi:hypothetical protein